MWSSIYHKIFAGIRCILRIVCACSICCECPRASGCISPFLEENFQQHCYIVIYSPGLSMHEQYLRSGNVYDRHLQQAARLAVSCRDSCHTSCWGIMIICYFDSRYLIIISTLLQIASGLISLKKVHTLGDAYLLVVMYPLSLLLVMGLQHIGWD